ncbi:thioesterase-like superfamily-domain-containing protein [Syncephalis fuscata]|nr:thioesterase-like superfamily-domain-containing protein [Syncephalis fuscata]
MSDSIPAQPKSTPERALIEAFLELEEIEPNLYRADSRRLWLPPNARGVFGGQVVAQSLVAATKTVPAEFNVHSLHSYFLLPGNHTLPIIYHVQRVRDGKSFATRTVKASQNGRCIFTCTVSFQVAESSPYKYQVNMPVAADPDSLKNNKELIQKWLKQKDKVPAFVKDEFELRLKDSSPIDLRHCEEPTLDDYKNPVKRSPYGLLWMRTEGALDDELRLHQCVLAYATDHQLLWSAIKPTGVSMYSRPDHVQMIASLDHTIWFHAPFRADEWLLYETDCDWLGSNRAFVTGRVFTRDGRLVASVAQEGVIRIGRDDAPKKTRSHKL